MTAEGEQTLAKQALGQQRELAGAGLTGRLGDQETLASRALTQEATMAAADRTARAEEFRQQRDLAVGEALGEFGPAVMGTSMGEGAPPRQTLAGKQSEAAIANELARLTGTTAAGDPTLAGRALAQEGTQAAEARRLAREELTGQISDPEGDLTTPSLAGRQVGTAEAAGEFEKERDILNILLAAEREKGFKGMTSQADLSDRIKLLTRSQKAGGGGGNGESWQEGGTNLSRENIDQGVADGTYTVGEDGITVRDEDGIVGVYQAGLQKALDDNPARYKVIQSGGFNKVYDLELGKVVGIRTVKFKYGERHADEGWTPAEDDD